MSIISNPEKIHFNVSHQLFLLLLVPTTKDSKIEEQWVILLKKAREAGVPIPAETISAFSEARPDLARKLANTPA